MSEIKFITLAIQSGPPEEVEDSHLRTFDINQ